MSAASDWPIWATGTLTGIDAPIDSINADTLWAWTVAESGSAGMWKNNPLNTTQPWPGATDINTVGVKNYLTIQDGIEATVTTLLNGYYPVILANLRGSVARANWGNACPNLGTWGTGCGWLQATYGAAPGNLTTGGLDMASADQIYIELRGDGQFSKLDMILKRLGLPSADVADKPLVVGSVDTAPILAAIADLKAHPAITSDPALLAAIQKIDSHFSGH